MAVCGYWMLYLTVILAGVTSSVEALRCYQCNSNDDTDCFAPPKNFTEAQYRDNQTVVGRLLMECSRDEHGREPFCIKSSVLVLGGNLPDHTRVLRECQYERWVRPCYRVYNGGHEEITCQCDSDGCNGATQRSASIVVLLLMSVGVSYRLLASGTS
ncbi:uncharacterized protein LOC118457001 [Anopheles albimanus]|uniref:Uncharacterized protein n=1 Tax=Anopheles albimanus TaxID=7167 RepID=A0A182F4U9_ANOAL|nr:uncharacterized protein LOC118457001 [Anopheles albimanus]